MKLSDFDYQLPGELIAQQPLDERDQSRLMLVHRGSGNIEHLRFYQLPDVLSPTDLVVINNTRVIPARLFAVRRDTGGRVEILLLRKHGEDAWEALVRPARRVRAGTALDIPGARLKAEAVAALPYGRRILKFEGEDLLSVLRRIGRAPLPPYIKRPPTSANGLDLQRYQTVYAKVEGSVAAPTAGLHFTPKVLQALSRKGIRVVEITLHVGYGTFQPVRTEKLEDHRMEAEPYEISQEAATAINVALGSGRRIIAVGTTTTRALEDCATRNEGKISAGKALASLFIYPGYEFKVIQGLLTNFHLPRSTLLALVSAFAGRDLIMRCYQEAIKQRYRFYSYGDCMLIL